LAKEVNDVTSIEAIIDRQLRRWELESREAEEGQPERPRPAPIITISRQTGSRGSYFGSRLAQRLGYQRLHRKAIDLICKTSGYRKRIVESLDGTFRSRLELLMESILTGQAVDATDYTRHLCQVVLSMSELGGVVLMGRGGSFILGPKRGFHMRVICPRAKRIENLIKYKELSEEEAAETVDASDVRRKKFARENFDVDINEPHHYDMVVNSALIDVEEMIEVAAVAVNAKMAKLTYLDHDQM
jgi:cytidylate kinase